MFSWFDWQAPGPASSKTSEIMKQVGITSSQTVEAQTVELRPLWSLGAQMLEPRPEPKLENRGNSSPWTVGAKQLEPPPEPKHLEPVPKQLEPKGKPSHEEAVGTQTLGWSPNNWNPSRSPHTVRRAQQRIPDSGTSNSPF